MMSPARAGARVIGLVGRIGSGKNTAADYLRKRYGVAVVAIGDEVRQIAERRGVLPRRGRLQRLSLEIAEARGPDWLAHRVADRIEADHPGVVAVPDVRTPEQVRVLRERFGDEFCLVAVRVSGEIRAARVIARGEDRDPANVEGFVQQDDEEERLFHLSETLDLADATLPNDRDLATLHRQIDEMVGEAERLNGLPRAR